MVGIYVHWPFCESKCPYCDFNSHVRDHVDADAYTSALLRELDSFAVETPDSTVSSIFFGGGTPSLMPEAAVARVIERVADRWAVDGDLEITLEANPGSVEVGRLAGFRAAGVNRVSIGVQSLEDEALRFLGRRHNAEEARAAVRIAGRLFDRFSFDLIYARPDQTARQWERELRDAVALAGDHLSVYQLTIEPGTAFARAFDQGRLTIPGDIESEALYDVTHAILDAAGLPAYEISNHARPGHECRHNLIYWRYDPYIGVGPGAHGRLPGADDAPRIATEAIRAPEAWVHAVSRNGVGTRTRRPIMSRVAAEEAVIMGLRLTEGIEQDRFRANTGSRLSQVIDPSRREALIASDDLMESRNDLRATAKGRKRLNAIIGYLLASDTDQ